MYNRNKQLIVIFYNGLKNNMVVEFMSEFYVDKVLASTSAQQLTSSTNLQNTELKKLCCDFSSGNSIQYN